MQLCLESSDQCIWKNRLEHVQNRFIRYVQYKNINIYPSRWISHLRMKYSLNTLEISRTNVFFKIVRGNITSQDLLDQINFYIPTFYWRDPPLFRVQNYRTNLEWNTALCRMCQTYNLPSREIDIFYYSLNCFEKIFMVHIF